MLRRVLASSKADAFTYVHARTMEAVVVGESWKIIHCSTIVHPIAMALIVED